MSVGTVHGILLREHCECVAVWGFLTDKWVRKMTSDPVPINQFFAVTVAVSVSWFPYRYKVGKDISTLLQAASLV
jgi:hypothetical protein